MYNEFIKWAKDNSWNVVEKSNISLNLENEIGEIYKNMPNEYIEFLKRVKGLISPRGTSWFLCEDEYNNNSSIVFKWNEFQILSIEAAGNDIQWKEEINLFWNKIIPIVMSVDNGYLYYAIDLNNDKSIVKGYEPEFEEVEQVANNIEEFLQLIIEGKIKL